MVTLALSLLVTPAPEVTWIVPCATFRGVVSAILSTSATETPEIGRAVSSATLCAPGTVLTGGAFAAWTATAMEAVAVVMLSVDPKGGASGTWVVRLGGELRPARARLIRRDG